MSALSKILLAVFLLVSFAGAQSAAAQESAAAPKKDLKIAAAADLSAAIDKLGSVFEKQTGVHVSVSLGSSGNFFAQIQNGAPFDVFLSADKRYPEKLAEAGKIEGALVLYARGRLVLWVPNSSSLQLPSKGHPLDGNLDALNWPAVRKIAIANPEHAPYGRAAVAVLMHYGVYEQVKSKIVLGENVSQTAQFAQSGNADVAFIALSQALSEALNREGYWLTLPQGSYPPIEQAGAVLKTSHSKQMAWRFLEFLTSPEAQAILHNFGFEAPGK